MINTSGKAALVTGGSRGIGAAIAERLGKAGFHVLVNFAKSEAHAQGVRDKIIAAGGSAELCPFDVADSTAVNAQFEKITAQHGGLAVLVNNAGINQDRLLLRLSDEDLDQVIATNLKGTIYCTRAAVKGMMKARQGSIIHISSVVGEMGNAGQSAYAATKAGVIGFSKSVTKELASRGIRSNVVTPGYIETEMTGALTEAQKEAILRGIPLGSFGQPQEIAALVAFLALPESRYITGQVIGINGGMYV